MCPPDLLADWRKYGESAFVVRVLEPLAYDAEPRVIEATVLRWRTHFARLGRLYNVPRCSMCGRPHDLASGAGAATPSCRSVPT